MQHLYYLKWFRSYGVMKSWFRNLPRDVKFQNMGACRNKVFHFAHRNLVALCFVIGRTQATLQTRSCICPVFGVWSFMLHHFTNLCCGFRLLLGVHWEWISLSLISSKFWTKSRRNYLWSFGYHRMIEWNSYSI